MALFEENTPLIPDNPLETLVGEDKKYKTPEELARAKFHADFAIQARERENAELREELNKRLTAEQLIEQMRAKADTPPPVQNGDDDTNRAPAAEKPSFTDEDLAKRVREITEAQSREARIRANAQEVRDRLLQIYGTEDQANAAVVKRAQELGVSVTFLQQSAEASPKAFYAQLGIDTPVARTGVSPSRGDVNTTALPDTSRSKHKRYADFEAIRKADPAKYFTPEIQNQLHAAAFAAHERGEDFYAK